jgi:phosphatidylglycerol lysyltransferase
MDTNAREKSKQGKTLWKKVKPLLIVAILFGALFLLYNQLKNYHYRDLVKQLETYSAWTIAIALVITGCNYFILTFYDVLAMRYIKKKLPYGNVALASFMSYVFSYNIGLSLFGSSTIRYRFYASWHLDGTDIAKIIAFCVSTFWIGLGTMGGLALALTPPSASLFPKLGLWANVLGIAMVLSVLAYGYACIKQKKTFHFKSLSIGFPPPRIAFSQILVSSLDWFLAALVFYVLLPAGRPAFLSFLGIFVIAQLAGATSHVPGGLGVFDSLIMLALSSSVRSDILFGILLVYRGIYYLTPLLVAIVTFVVREGLAKGKIIEKGAKQTMHAVSPFIPTVLSLLVFFSGALLMFSIATPSVKQRLLLLDPFIPLKLLELSHFAASLTALGLLVIADALRRRIDLAYYLTLLLLGIGAVFSLLKGLDWEEALILCSVLLIMLPSRKLFNRQASLIAPTSIVQWSVSVATVLSAALWLGFFSYKHVQYSNDLWWVFAFERDAPRFLRASLGIGIMALLISLRILLSPVSRMEHKTLEDCEDKILSILATSMRAEANLALLQDKYFFFDKDNTAFLMYGENGRTLVVMGDPVGKKEAFQNLVWSFYEKTRQQGTRIIWYEISAEHLPVFIELGMHIFKIGEKALVDLPTFSLDGAKGKNLRTPPQQADERRLYLLGLGETGSCPAPGRDRKRIKQMAAGKGRERERLLPWVFQQRVPSAFSLCSSDA